MNRTILVLTLMLLLSSATTVRVVASNDIPTVNSPLNNLVGQASTNPGTTTNPQPNLTANSSSVAQSPDEIGSVGGSQAHLNQQPVTTISFIIPLVALLY